MLKDRKQLENFLCSKFINIEDVEEKQRYCVDLEKLYGIPIDISHSILSIQKDLSEYNEFILFAITSVINKNIIKTYFTEREIDTYSGQKFKPQKIKFPIRIPMFQVDTDQWIGVTSAQFLMKLRDSQYINYNADTQRALETMLRDGNIIYRPSVNNKSVKQITALYESHEFIPNTISLNINADDFETDFVFDDNELIIKQLKYFDIFDGYHRYLAMGAAFDKDKTFDYPMELRITNFSVSKARQFIYQEQNQNKMAKVDTNAYNQFNAGNIVVERLNKDPKCNLYNNINLNGGVINAGWLAAIINKTYFNSGKNVGRKDVIFVANNITSAINNFTEEYIEYLDKSWSRAETNIILYGIFRNENPQTIMDTLKKANLKDYNTTQITNRIITKLEEVYGNV